MKHLDQLVRTSQIFRKGLEFKLDIKCGFMTLGTLDVHTLFKLEFLLDINFNYLDKDIE